MTPEEFRARFPMLARKVYLASCSLGARSTELDSALSAMLTAMAEHGSPWHDFEQQGELARQRFAELIGARPDQIALVPNASIGAYQIASTIDLRNRSKIVLSQDEFPSLSHVWLAQQARGAEVVYVRDADYSPALDERTALVSVPVTTYQDSLRMPVAETTALAHAVGAQVFVDAYQSLGVEPVRIDELDCDFLVGGTAKYLLGLPGIAFLYVRAPASVDLPPTLTGWFGRVDPFAFDPFRLDFPDTARRFETGTPPVPALYAANAGLGLIRRLDPAAVRAHVRELVRLTVDRLTEQGEKTRTTGDPDRHGAHVALIDPDPGALAGWLADQQVLISPRGDVGRIAFHYYNNAEDVYRLCAQIACYRRRQPSERN
ncbi:MAG: aminotransferase class V-fold PLP-dependent enzyme [Streptosporangiaceae bacterium]|jgi:selenocysteine lyase/cysteine desulfurase